MQKELRVHHLGPEHLYRPFTSILRTKYVCTFQRPTFPPPHIVIGRASAWLKNPFLIYKLRWQYGPRTIFVSLTSENRPPDYKNMDYMFSFFPTDSRNFQANPLIAGPYQNKELQAESLQYRAMPKTRFCNFLYSNSLSKDTEKRINFCHLLSKYKKVDCGGKSLNNHPRIEYGLDNKLQFLQHYKFTIAFENQSTEWYLTEKIYHAFLAGSIPIYWGCSQVARFYNPESFINCHDFNSFEEVVNRVKEIDNNPDLYARYRAAEPVFPDSPMHNHSVEKILQRWTIIAEKAFDNFEQPSSLWTDIKHKLLRSFIPLILSSHLFLSRPLRRWFRSFMLRVWVMRRTKV